MLELLRTADAIAARMDGRPSGQAALLPSPAVQNRAAILAAGPEGLDCVWFGGSLEGKADIRAYRSRLGPDGWSAGQQLADDPDRSEQNPILSRAPDARLLLIRSAQAGGGQDRCVAGRCALVTTRPGASGDAPVPGVKRAPLVVVSSDDGAAFPRQVVVATDGGACLSNDRTDGRNQDLSCPALAEAPGSGIDVAFTLHRRAIAHVRLVPSDIEGPQ